MRTSPHDVTLRRNRTCLSERICRKCATVLPDASALNSVLAFRAVPYVFCSADRTKPGSRVSTLKAKRYSRLSSLSIPIPSRVARDAIGFSPQAVQFFANCMYHYAVVHLGPPRREIRLPRIRTTPLGTMRITPLSSSLEGVRLAASM